MDKNIRIGLLNNKIRIVRFIIIIHQKNTIEEEFIYEEFAFDEDEKNKIINDLNNQPNVTYTIESMNIPFEYEKYDNMEWNGYLKDALLMIENDPDYQINQLKKQLSDMDYKTSKYVDGDYTQEEWNVISLERKEIRRKINELELTKEENKSV